MRGVMMIRASILAMLAGSVAQLSAETSMAVGRGDAMVFSVDSGALVQSVPVISSDGGAIVKKGAGMWELPYSCLSPWTIPTFAILDGSLTLKPSTGTFAMPCPQDIVGKAALWLDAKQEDTFETVRSNDTDYVDFWYDVRETSHVTPVRMYAKAFRSVALNTAKTQYPLSPEKASVGDNPVVYFGGTSSGRSMNWMMPNGVQANSRNVMTVFIVHGVDSSFGQLIGYNQGTSAAIGGSDFNLDQYGARGSWGVYCRPESSGLKHSRIYENGREINPSKAKAPAGLSLFEVVTTDRALLANNFFNPCNLIGEQSLWLPQRAGGDYIAEALVFTNRLMESERVRVEAYLLAKWGIRAPAASQQNVLLSERGRLAYCSATDTEDAMSAFDGTGIIEKSGDGNLLVSGAETDELSTAFQLKEGAVTLNRQSRFVVADGECYDASPVSGGTRVTSDAAGDGRLIKTGSDWMGIRAVPSTVSELQVNGGALEINPFVSTTELSSPDEVYIESSGFEDASASGYKGFGAGYTRLGWTSNPESDRFSGVMAYDVTNGRPYYDIYSTPPDGGKYVCYLSPHTWVRTPVSILEDGEYEVSFWTGGKYNQSKQLGARVNVRLISVDGSVTNKLGSGMYRDNNAFVKNRLVGQVRAGQYYLYFANEIGDHAPVTFDDVHMRRVLKPSTAIRIPGGDFEDAQFVFTSSESGFQFLRTSNTAPNWAFVQPDGWTSDQAAVGLVTSIFSEGDYSNATRAPEGGNIQLLFAGDGSKAITSFAAEKGRYRVRASLAAVLTTDQAGTAVSGGSLTAVVVVGDKEKSLGTVSTDSSSFGDFEWPGVLDVEAPGEVVLSIAYSNAGKGQSKLLADDFVLEREAVNLVQNWSFEQGNGASAEGWNQGEGTSRVSVHDYPSHFGREVYDGSYWLSIVQNGVASQDVAFPSSGRYRLSFRAKTRHEPGYPTWDGYDRGKIAVDLQNGDETIHVVPPFVVASTNFVQHVFCFEIPSAGTWSVVARGVAYEGSTRRQTLLDGVSIVKDESVYAGGDALPRNLCVKVSSGSALCLSYDGQVEVEEIRLGGRRVSGVVDATTHPDYIYGRGRLYARPRGLAIIVR